MRQPRSLSYGGIREIPGRSAVNRKCYWGAVKGHMGGEACWWDKMAGVGPSGP